MQYLQLAEDGDYDLSSGDYYLSEDPTYNYIFVPDATGGKWVNLEMFSDLTGEDFETMIEALGPYQPDLQEDDGMGLFGIGKKAQEWKKQKREARLEKQRAKSEKIRGRAHLLRGKGESYAGGERPTGIGDVFSGIVSTVGSIFGGGQQQAPQERFDVTGGVSFSTEEPPGFFKQYGTVMIIGGVVLVGGLLLLRKK